jgi:hypothetical protein
MRPDRQAIIELSHKTPRMQRRRFTRLTEGHSYKWENHTAAIGLFFACYNFSALTRRSKRRQRKQRN